MHFTGYKVDFSIFDIYIYIYPFLGASSQENTSGGLLLNGDNLALLHFRTPAFFIDDSGADFHAD